MVATTASAENLDNAKALQLLQVSLGEETAIPGASARTFSPSARPKLFFSFDQAGRSLSKAGKEALFGFFVGQSMKAMQSKANPQMVNEAIRKALG